MPLKETESNKAFRYATSFDMSSSTSLSLKFIPPSDTGIASFVIDSSGGRVTAPAVGVTDADLGALSANEYMEFDTLTTDFIVGSAGTGWKVCGTFTNTATTPDSIFVGDTAEFTIDAIC